MDIKATCLVLIFSACNIWHLIEGIAYVISGHEAQQGEVSWQAFVVDAQPQVDTDYRCGGAIISQHWIMSTASCIQRFGGNSKSALIYVGTLISSAPGIVHQSRFMVFHPDYNKHSVQRDLALIMTRHKITFNPRVSAIALPNAPISNFTSGEIAGWGHAHYRSTKYAENLRVTSLKIVKTDECRALLESENARLAFDQFCASASGAGACFGDEGGAFVTQYVVSGLISQAFCTLNDFPTVFVDVYIHLDWIRSTTGLS